MRTIARKTALMALAIVIGLAPQTAFASEIMRTATVDEKAAEELLQEQTEQDEQAGEALDSDAEPANDSDSASDEQASGETSDADDGETTPNVEDTSVNHVLAYDPALIAQIGTQEQTGHTICCPSFSCAYADAVMDGTVHDHSYYTCSCCTWTDWGGGGSSNRCVGSDEQLLREAYDQIRQGKPTVIHVSAGYGEHWIALIGYVDAYDPDHLTLWNFVALDPWDGRQFVAGESYALYGDGCEHISDR